jgi:mannose-6-phosphate isomerase-like protein (cupin superfamily)
MDFRIVTPREERWETRPHAEGEPARHVAELSETFVVLAGTLSIYLGEPPERRDVPAGSLVHVKAGTSLQSVNHGVDDLVVYAHGWPPEDHHAELLPSAVR